MAPSHISAWPQTNLKLDKDGAILNGERFSFDKALNPKTMASAIQSYGDILFWKAYESFLIRDPEAFAPKFEKFSNIFGSPLAAPNFSERKDDGNRFPDNYASSIIHGSLANRSEIPPPFQELPLIGRENQSTVHFHCGINNNELTIIEGGTKIG